MKKSKGYYNTVIIHFTNNNGKWLRGWDNRINPESLLQKMGVKWNGDRYSSAYRNAQQSLCRFTQMISATTDFVAGGVSNKPTEYFIAATKEEENMIYNNRKGDTAGRIITRMNKAKHMAPQIVQKRANLLINDMRRMGEEI